LLVFRCHDIEHAGLVTFEHVDDLSGPEVIEAEVAAGVGGDAVVTVTTYHHTLNLGRSDHVVGRISNCVPNQTSTFINTNVCCNNTNGQ